jgi:hypothetical protein
MDWFWSFFCVEDGGIEGFQFSMGVRGVQCYSMNNDRWDAWGRSCSVSNVWSGGYIEGHFYRLNVFSKSLTPRDSDIGILHTRVYFPKLCRVYRVANA